MERSGSVAVSPIGDAAARRRHMLRVRAVVASRALLPPLASASRVLFPTQPRGSRGPRRPHCASLMRRELASCGGLVVARDKKGPFERVAPVATGGTPRLSRAHRRPRRPRASSGVGRVYSSSSLLFFASCEPMYTAECTRQTKQKPSQKKIQSAVPDSDASCGARTTPGGVKKRRGERE